MSELIKYELKIELSYVPLLKLFGKTSYPKNIHPSELFEDWEIEISEEREKELEEKERKDPFCSNSKGCSCMNPTWLSHTKYMIYEDNISTIHNKIFSKCEYYCDELWDKYSYLLENQLNEEQLYSLLPTGTIVEIEWETDKDRLNSLLKLLPATDKFHKVIEN